MIYTADKVVKFDEINQRKGCLYSHNINCIVLLRIKQGKMSGVGYITRMGDMRMRTKFRYEDLKERH